MFYFLLPILKNSRFLHKSYEQYPKNAFFAILLKK